MTDEIIQINNDLEQIDNDIVNDMAKIIPSQIVLDFIINSIKIINQLIAKLRMECEDENVVENEIVAFGAYIGQVVKKNYGGHWTKPELAGYPKDSSTYSVAFQLFNWFGINPLGRVLKYFRH